MWSITIWCVPENSETGTTLQRWKIWKYDWTKDYSRVIQKNGRHGDPDSEQEELLERRGDDTEHAPICPRIYAQ